LLGSPVVAIDAAHAMVAVLRRERPHTPAVQADLEHLPLRRGAVEGAWASKSYQHIAHESLPLALADLHRAVAVGGPVIVTVFAGDGTRISDDDRDMPGRRFSLWDPMALRAVFEGAGFAIVSCDVLEERLVIHATRARTLPDFVRPDLRVLFCGYNPSVYAADRGVPFARPGNRFWPAAIESGLVSVDRDPWHAVRHHDVGFTDLVKRATVAAAELSIDELRGGLTRITTVCEWLRPEVVCILGVGSWRSVVDRRAQVGWQEQRIGPSRVYVMPNPSGLNASTQHAGFVEHMTCVAGR
jgi:TDG/mug DNA glycosylase family protein